MSKEYGKFQIYRFKSHIEQNMPNNEDLEKPMYRIPYNSDHPSDGSDYVTLELLEGLTKDELQKHKQSYLKAVKKTKKLRVDSYQNAFITRTVAIPSDHFYSIDDKCDKFTQKMPDGSTKCKAGLNRVTHITYPMNREKLHVESVYEPYRLLGYNKCFKHSAKEFLAEPDFPEYPEYAGIKEDKEYLKSGAKVLKTIFELHKNNISCMGIGEDNIFVNCYDEDWRNPNYYNFFLLNGKDFRAFDSTEDMFNGCQVSGDYYNYLRILLFVYVKLLHRGKSKKNQKTAYDKIKKVEWMQEPKDILSSSDDKKKGKLNKAVESVLHVKDKSLVHLLLDALHACATNELHENRHIVPEPKFYKKYIEPIVNFFDGDDDAALKKHKEVFHHTNFFGMGGRKRRKRSKKRRKSRRKSKRKRKRTKKRRRR